MTPARTLAALAAALLPVALTACPTGKEKETEPPLPSAAVSAPVATAAPTAMVIAPEPKEAGADVSDASDASDAGDAAQPKTGGPSNLAKCCAAIEQNQNKAPPEQVPLYAGFITLCKSGIVPAQFRSLAPCK